MPHGGRRSIYFLEHREINALSLFRHHEFIKKEYAKYGKIVLDIGFKPQ